jgi:hypothetical protein
MKLGFALSRFAFSPANWCGLGLATVALLLSALGIASWGAAWLALLGYGAGFGVGALWFGLPRLAPTPWDELEFKDEGDARQAMEHALSAVRQLVDYNPDGRLPASLQAKVRDLCKQLEALLQQWERSKGKLSLEESFHARHIALSYLPEALKTYLSIPPRFASTKLLDNGKTAEDTFKATLDDLSGKVLQLTNDLAQQDADAFLNHSRFLQQKFSGADEEGARLLAGGGGNRGARPRA